MAVAEKATARGSRYAGKLYPQPILKSILDIDLPGRTCVPTDIRGGDGKKFTIRELNED